MIHLQMSYMISAWARICKIMGSRFAPYLPHVMGPIMKTASLKPEVALLDNDELNGVDEAHQEPHEYRCLVRLGNKLHRLFHAQTLDAAWLRKVALYTRFKLRV